MRMLAAGTIAATIINANPYRAEGIKLSSPWDFVPDSEGQKKEEEEAPQSQEALIASMAAFFGCGPGTGSSKSKAN